MKAWMAAVGMLTAIYAVLTAIGMYAGQSPIACPNGVPEVSADHIAAWATLDGLVCLTMAILLLAAYRTPQFARAKVLLLAAIFVMAVETGLHAVAVLAAQTQSCNQFALLPSQFSVTGVLQLAAAILVFAAACRAVAVYQQPKEKK